MWAEFKKNSEVRIKVGEHEGQFGVVKKVTDDEGKRFLRIKLEKSNKMIEQTSDEVKIIAEAKLPQEFNTIGDLQDREDFLLVSVDTDIEATKDMIADPRKDDYDGFFIKTGEGEILQAYGFKGAVPKLDADLTRLETTTEHLKRVIV